MIFYGELIMTFNISKLMGSNIDNFCNCKELRDVFNPELEDVN